MKKLISLLIALTAFLPMSAVLSAPVQKATLINLEGTKKAVVVNSKEASFYISKLGYHLMTNRLGASIYQTPALFETSLASAIGKTDTTATLVSGKTRDGLSLSGNYCFTLDSGLNTAEYICGVASSTALTGLIRGIGSDGVTSFASLKYTHRYGADVKITDFPVLQQIVRMLNGQDSLPGGIMFGTGTITGLTATPLSTATSSAANVNYVNNTALVSAPNAAEGVKGVVDLATRAQMASGASSGVSSSNLVLQSKYASATSSATTTIPITNTSGKLDKSFIDDTLNYLWTPVGSITAYATSTAPTGWKLCDGSALATSTYSSLFSVIGYTFGGNGTSTFALPDLRGRQITMASSTATYATSTGIIGGEAKHTQTIPELAAHSHTYTLSQTTAAPRTNANYINNGAPDSGISGDTNSVGSSTPFNVLDPYLTLNYIIKY